MGSLWVEIVFLGVLVLANGLFALAELALVSSRRGRLRQWAERGDRRARMALELAEDPNTLLSTVQVGITFVGTLAGVFGGATVAERLAGWLAGFPMVAAYRQPLALGLVVAVVTYLSLVLGELVPKRLALSHPEAIAIRVAGPLRFLSRLAVPLVHFLGASTNAVLRLFRVKADGAPVMTQEDLHVVIEEGAQAGVVGEVEHAMVKRVFRLGDYPARVLMTPRADVVWIDVADGPAEVRRKVTQSPHSRFPVCEGDLDRVEGIVEAKDLLARGLDFAYDVRSLIKIPLFVYEGISGLDVLERFRASGTHIAVILDEYGSVAGLLTTKDILEAIVGDLPTPAERDDPRAVQRPDGSWLLDGTLTTGELRDLLAMPDLPEGGYHTLAGLVLLQLGRIPKVADQFVLEGYRFEVVDMDDNRIDRVLVVPPGVRGDGMAAAG